MVGLRRVIATAYDLCNAPDADPLYMVRKAVFYMVGSAEIRVFTSFHLPPKGGELQFSSSLLSLHNCPERKPFITISTNQKVTIFWVHFIVAVAICLVKLQTSSQEIGSNSSNNKIAEASSRDKDKDTIR